MSGSGWFMKILSGASALGSVLPFPTITDQLVLVSKSSSLGVQGCSPGGQELKVAWQGFETVVRNKAGQTEARGMIYAY